MTTYLSVYIGSLLLAMLITPLVIYIAQALKIYDEPGARKVHACSVPRIGGVAVFLSVIALVVTVLFLDNSVGDAFRRIRIQMVMLLATSSLVFVLGFIDDLRGIRARHKLLAQVMAAAVLCLAGVRINSLNFVNLFTLRFGWVSFPITIFWVVAITNAVNLIDGLDGLAAGICAVTCAVIAAFAFNSGQPVMVILMLALLGSLSGFLLFNFNPARIFLGDCGSMFLGFFLASASVICAMKTGTVVALALPALALGLPIFDTVFSMFRRFLKRRGIMSPDRGHLHHRLVDMGFRQRHVVIAMYAITVIAAGLGMFMMLARGAGAIGIFFCVLLLLALVFHLAGAVRLRDTIAGLRKKYVISRQMKLEMENFEKAELHFRQAETFEQWWQATCVAADKMGFVRSALPLTNRDGSKRILVWQQNDTDIQPYEISEMTLPVRDRRAGSLLKLEVQVYANGSLESAGRRVALFARLIEEHSVGNLPKQHQTYLDTRL
ncbi:MAG: glycosyltransferase family 4 protein [Sedimentisphaerales bacterium]